MHEGQNDPITTWVRVPQTWQQTQMGRYGRPLGEPDREQSEFDDERFPSRPRSFLGGGLQMLLKTRNVLTWSHISINPRDVEERSEETEPLGISGSVESVMEHGDSDDPGAAIVTNTEQAQGVEVSLFESSHSGAQDFPLQEESVERWQSGAVGRKCTVMPVVRLRYDDLGKSSDQPKETVHRGLRIHISQCDNDVSVNIVQPVL